MSACNHQCLQGRRCTCAIVRFAAESEGVMPMATGCSLKAPPKPVEPPPVDKPDHVLHLLQWLALSAVLAFTVAATAGFFTNK